MARPKNELETVNITLTVNKVMLGDLDRIVRTGLFGNGRASCVERLTAESIRGLIKEGVLPKRKAELT